MSTPTTRFVRTTASSAMRRYTLRDIVFSLVFVLLPYGAMAGALLLKG